MSEITDEKLAILERFGSGDIQDLCTEVERLRALTAMDAWKQEYELIKKYSTSVDVRPDLRVVALGCDRVVQFSLAYPPDEHGMRRWHTTTRNVGTMRELAHALLEACDFVERANPTWAAS